MGCLSNLVGLRDACGDVLIESSTGYWLNDLPGIELGILAAGASKEALNAKELVERQLALAELTILDSYRAQLKSRWKVNSLLESKTTGLYKDDTAQAAQAFNVGQFFKSDNPYGELEIVSISLYVNFTGAVPVNIWDATTGALLHTVTFQAVAGEVVTQNAFFSHPANGQKIRVFVGYDATNVATYKTLISHSGCMECKGGMHDFNHLQVYSRKVAIGNQVIEKNLKGQNGMSGLSITWGLNCSIDNLICSMGSSLAPAVMFKTGSLLARALKHSKRLSPDVIYFRSDNEELANDYEADFSMYFTTALESAIIPKGECFKCTSQVKMRKTG